MIGIFDSGVGGLTVLSEIWKVLPQYQTIYLGDLAHLPYGNKSPETIYRLSCQNIDFLIQKGAKIIVIACNTASALAGDKLKKKYKLPTFDVLSPAVEYAIGVTKNKSIGVIGTQGTITSKAYEEKIKKRDSKIHIYGKACPLLVPLIEEGWIDKVETKRILRYYLRPLKHANIDTLILGCTHYPILQKQITQIMGPKVQLVSSATEVANTLKKYLIKNKKIALQLQKNKNHQIYVTDTPYNLQDIARKFLKNHIPKVEKVELD